VNPSDLLGLLCDLHHDKAVLAARHEAVARLVGDYDTNNMYQYVIAREHTHLAWVRDAVESMGGAAPPAADSGTAAPPAGPAAALSRDDAGRVEAFLEKWQGKADAVTNARHKLMLDLLLGETREHKRFFDQAAAGRSDLLGRRTGGPPVGGHVIAARWIE
jgi:hypothetical protein